MEHFEANRTVKCSERTFEKLPNTIINPLIDITLGNVAIVENDIGDIGKEDCPSNHIFS